MSKKILSVRPTKNPCKFIFETEMSADELTHLMQAEFPNNYECIVSIKPSGLWKDKLFVTARAGYFDSYNLNTLVTALNKKLEAEEAVDWVVEYVGSINTVMHVKESTARYFACACNQDQYAYYYGNRIETKNIKLIKNTVTGEQLWPRKTEQKKTYCEVVVAHHTPVFVTHEDANEIIGWMKNIVKLNTNGKGFLTTNTTTIKTSIGTHVAAHFNDIKHIYDENGNDMLADGLAKAQKTADVWHVEVQRQAIDGDTKFDLLPRMGLNFLDQLQSTDGRKYVSFVDMLGRTFHFTISSVLRLWNNEKTLWSHEDKKPEATFKAPSLLSRIYE